jgi:sortase A
MAIQPRATRTTADQETLDLLQALIETPPSPSTARLQPIALRSAIEQRRHALGRYLLRTWVDALLRHAERLVLLATLVVFGIWLADGPVRDWLHEHRQPELGGPVVSAAAPLAQPAAHPSKLDRSIPLPYTTPNMAREASQPDFIAPRQRVATAPVPVAPQPTRLLIPSIALDTPVKEVFVVDGAWEVADYAAGYLHDTALPGEPGNAALAGHAGLRGAVFRDLGALTAGADVYVDAAGWRYHYRVREAKSVWPTQLEVLAPTDTAVLTLITCTNWDTQRLVVVADLVGSKPSPGS